MPFVTKRSWLQYGSAPGRAARAHPRSNAPLRSPSAPAAELAASAGGRLSAGALSPFTPGSDRFTHECVAQVHHHHKVIGR
eukprot:2337492-Pyramimonas_sp.AAC.1